MNAIGSKIIELHDKVYTAYKIAEGKNFERDELLQALFLAKELKGYVDGIEGRYITEIKGFTHD